MAKKEKKFFRNCCNCDKQLGHTSARGRDRAESNGSVCRSCANTLYKTGRPVSAERNAKISSTMKGAIKTDEHIAKLKAARRITIQKKIDAITKMYGEKNVYPKHHFIEWAKDVKTRDSYTCVRCNTVATGYYINAHHVIPKEYFPNQALNINNGVTLCTTCHKQIHAFVDRLTLSGVKLDAEGFQTHTSRFINGNKPTNVPTEYKSVFQPMITSHKE